MLNTNSFLCLINEEDFQLIDDTPIDTSIIKRDYKKIYHQQGAQLNDSDQGNDFLLGENNNYHQVGIGCLEFHTTLGKDGVDFNKIVDGNVDETIRLVKNAFAYAFSTAALSTTGGVEIEQNMYVGVSTNMTLSTSKDGELLSYFDKTDETRNGIKGYPLIKILFDIHEVAADRGRVKDHLAIEQIFGFC